MAGILIVDDAAFMRLTLKKMLEAHGHTIVGEAATGVEAIRKFVETKPDVTLLDITMEDMNGLDALREIKQRDPNAKIVICSALGQQKILAKAIEYGAKDFVVKPFEEIRLIEAVDKVFR